jgi:putative hydrolase of the HAD superfamily
MAMKMAGATSEEMLHVGDNPENDILAAKKLGILTVWFNPQNETWEHDLSPDYIITSIPELKDIMTQLCVS